MLEGKNIILRPLKRSDKEKTIQWRNNLEIIELAQLVRFPKTDEMEDAWFDNALTDTSNRNIYFALEEKKTKKFVGIIQLNQIDWISRTAIWGFIIGDKNDRGKGYSVEAPKLLFDYAFNILNLRKIFGYPLSNNHATIRMHEKIGIFKNEGVLKNHIYFNNKYYDVNILSIFKEDFLSTNQ